MIACPTFGPDGPAGISEALRVVDCMSASAASFAFSRLFGSDAVLGVALTVALTLYIAFYAIGLLTGRASLSIANLTPRMMTLGLALTFATSWVAYQAVIWNLLAGAPDQVASLLLNTRGSATSIFADQLDGLSGSVVTAAQSAEALQTYDHAGSMASVANLLWISGLLLILGTVGILLVSRIALGAVLALGPIFIIFGLFEGTRGLLEGWLKAAAMFALAPLICVLLGGAAVSLLGPVIDSLAALNGEVPVRVAGTLFVGSVVYCALMLIALKAASTMVSGWRLATVRPGQISPLLRSFDTERGRMEPLSLSGIIADGQKQDGGRRVSEVVRAASTVSLVEQKSAGGYQTGPLGAANGRQDDTSVRRIDRPRRDLRIGSLTQRFRAQSAQESIRS